MKRNAVVSLTHQELSLLACILGFIEAGETDGGPFDGESPQQRGANLRLFGEPRKQVSAARAN